VQIGAKLAVLLPHMGDVAAFDRHEFELDLSNAPNVRRAIRDTQPNMIVNAAA
jgi:dTDP-4-dehydrorhamnose reductase